MSSVETKPPPLKKSCAWHAPLSVGVHFEELLPKLVRTSYLHLSLGGSLLHSFTLGEPLRLDNFFQKLSSPGTTDTSRVCSTACCNIRSWNEIVDTLRTPHCTKILSDAGKTSPPRRSLPEIEARPQFARAASTLQVLPPFPIVEYHK